MLTKYALTLIGDVFSKSVLSLGERVDFEVKDFEAKNIYSLAPISKIASLKEFKPQNKLKVMGAFFIFVMLLFPVVNEPFLSIGANDTGLGKIASTLLLILAITFILGVNKFINIALIITSSIFVFLAYMELYSQIKEFEAIGLGRLFLSSHSAESIAVEAKKSWLYTLIPTLVLLVATFKQPKKQSNLFTKFLSL
ncbi:MULTISPECIES: hypothetical protein [Pseudoalteromonas]|uniref:hypothetical protein n=1 Tax=Pseudoalteromonas TaxID=53246 RepID=UPI001582DBAF|nr:MULTISPECIES: hypothetical protein [Pseudoalteromonas]MDI4654366.1 hypothetical protein [Pseudoalteromonas shioyasakiensis]NUJ40698.1 hypothetical protein [Pseudoalteromonas sp. 0303]